MILSLTGPSGAGKGYLREQLLSRYPSAKEATWVTTRPLRLGEEFRYDRESVSEKEFHQLCNAGSLWLVQHGLYGASYGMRNFPRICLSNDLWLTEFHIANLLSVREQGYNAISFAIIPGDIDFLRERLVKYRRTETQEQVMLRIRDAELEIRQIQKHHDLFRRIFITSHEREGDIGEEFLAVVEASLRGGSHV